MKGSSFLVSLLLILLSCNQNDSDMVSGHKISPRTRKKVMEIAVHYARKKLSDTQKTVTQNGTFIISDNQITCIIDPSSMVTGLIDNDAYEDAIFTITSYKGKIPFKSEHLILIKKDRKFTLTRVIEADMKIMVIKDMKIYAEISKFPSDSPQFGCEVCKEVVTYHYRDGNLVRTE